MSTGHANNQQRRDIFGACLMNLHIKNYIILLLLYIDQLQQLLLVFHIHVDLSWGGEEEGGALWRQLIIRKVILIVGIMWWDSSLVLIIFLFRVKVSIHVGNHLPLVLLRKLFNIVFIILIFLFIGFGRTECQIIPRYWLSISILIK